MNDLLLKFDYGVRRKIVKFFDRYHTIPKKGEHDCMADLKKLKLGKYRKVHYLDEELLKVIKKIVCESEYVYAYKTYDYSFDEGESDLMKWIKSTSLTNFKEVEIEFIEENRIEKIKTSVREEKVYKLELNKTTRKTFIKLFKVLVKGHGVCGGPRQLLLMDILQENYDFIFTIDKKVLLSTYIHSFDFLVSEKMILPENENMLDMAGLTKLKLGKYKHLCYQDEELLTVIKKTLCEAENVYAYKNNYGDSDETELIKWIKSTSLTNFKKVEIEFTEENRIWKIKSGFRKDKVYKFELNETTRNKFIELFKISITSTRRAFDFPTQLFTDDIYIDGPLYDNYNFVFTMGTKVLLLIDVCGFYFLASEEMTL